MSFSGALFDDDGYDARRLDSQRFNSFTKFDEFDSVADESVFVDTPLPIYVSGDGISVNSVYLKTELNGSAGMVYEEVGDEKGVALREWRRLNAIVLAEKDKVEKEMRNEILSEAEDFKAYFYKRRLATVEKMKVTNREKQKIFLENHEKFHNEAATNYWIAIAELVPKEVPALEKRGKKDREKKKPSITVIQGPKPGKPTDLSRMRQILSKLKLQAHPHLTPDTLDAKTNLPSGQAPSSQVVMAV